MVMAHIHLLPTKRRVNKEKRWIEVTVNGNHVNATSVKGESHTYLHNWYHSNRTAFTQQ